MKLIDTTDFFDDYNGDEYEFAKEDVLSFLGDFVHRYEKRYHTKVVNFLLLAERASCYGWISGNGAHGYRVEKSLSDLFLTNSDDMEVFVDENRKINFVYHDHDGSTYAELKLLPESVVEKADIAWDERGEDLYQQMAHCESVSGTNYFA